MRWRSNCPPWAETLTARQFNSHFHWITVAGTKTPPRSWVRRMIVHPAHYMYHPHRRRDAPILPNTTAFHPQICWQSSGTISLSSSHQERSSSFSELLWCFDLSTLFPINLWATHVSPPPQALQGSIRGAATEKQLFLLANFYTINQIDCVTVQISHYNGWKQWSTFATIQCLGHTSMNYVYMPEASGWRNGSEVNGFH